jgi:hypothetical protein
LSSRKEKRPGRIKRQFFFLFLAGRAKIKRSKSVLMVWWSRRQTSFSIGLIFYFIFLALYLLLLRYL